MTGKILFVGGTGVVGEQMVRQFRERNRDVPILIGGRNIEKAEALVRKVGLAEAVKVDTSKARLGLNTRTDVGAVAMLAPDAGLNGLQFALDIARPYFSIGNWLVEVGAEMAHFIRRPTVAPVMLSSHWHGGPTVFLALKAMEGLDVVHSITVSAIVDELDPTGPAALADMKMGEMGALAFQEGHRVWLTGQQATREIKAVDGRVLAANAFAPYDVVSLQAASGAGEVRFDIASGISSNRLRGGTIGTEVLIKITGGIDGQEVERRASLEFNRGQATLTGLSAAVSLSTLLGLAESPAFPSGLYFPETILEPEPFLNVLREAGAIINVNLGEGA